MLTECLLIILVVKIATCTLRESRFKRLTFWVVSKRNPLIPVSLRGTRCRSNLREDKNVVWGLLLLRRKDRSD
jgi:hypothetical protein